MEGPSREKYLKENASRMKTARAQESKDKSNKRKLIEAARRMEMRAEESDPERQKRIATQKLRQELLCSQETPEQTKTRQISDTLSKRSKRAAKAAGFEKSLNPNDDWNDKLNSDMIRKQNMQATEYDNEKKS